MRRLILALAVLALLLLLVSASAFAIGGVSAGGGARGGGGGGGISSSSGRSSAPSSSSSGSRSSGSSGSSSAPKSGSGGVRPSTPSQPSSGPKTQPAPAARLAPRSLPPNVRTPAGRNFVRDRAALSRNPRYMDPYNQAYFGNPQSPLFYLYLASLQDQSHGPPVPYQAQCKPRRTGHSTGVVVLWTIIGLIVGAVITAFICAVGRA